MENRKSAFFLADMNVAITFSAKIPIEDFAYNHKR
jgi:hypothetical protein